MIELLEFGLFSLFGLQLIDSAFRTSSGSAVVLLLGMIFH